MSTHIPPPLYAGWLRFGQHSIHLFDYVLWDDRGRRICGTDNSGRVIEFLNEKGDPYAWVDICPNTFHVYVRFAESGENMPVNSWLVRNEGGGRYFTFEGDKYRSDCSKEGFFVSGPRGVFAHIFALEESEEEPEVESITFVVMAPKARDNVKLVQRCFLSLCLFLSGLVSFGPVVN